MNNQGWIKLHRKILSNPIAIKDSDHFSIWCYLLLNATHTPYPTIFEGKKIILQAGQLITGRKSISSFWNISESKVQRILKRLENEQQIEQQTTPRNRLITVLNWDIYQDSERQSEQQVNNKRTTSEQQVNTNNNTKNVRSISKDIGTDVPATYGNEDINRLIKGINLNLGYSLPTDTRARRTASNILKVMDKNGVDGVKDGRAWLADDKWANIKKFLRDYIEFRVADGYGAESWFSFYDNVKLWIANEGKFPKSK